MMRFVDNNIIKSIRCKGMQVFILHQCLYGSKNIIPVDFSVTAGKQTGRDMLINNLLKALLRFTRNQSTMYYKQTTFRLRCPHIKGRKIRFTCTGSRNQQSTILALCPKCSNILQGCCLHFIRIDFVQLMYFRISMLTLAARLSVNTLISSNPFLSNRCSIIPRLIQLLLHLPD